MARSFSSSYLLRTAAPITAAPLSLAYWFKPTTTATFIGIEISDTIRDNKFALFGLSAGAIYAQTSSGGGSVNATTTANFAANTLQHACAVFAASNDRRAFLNGTNKGTNASSVTPGGTINRTSIGASVSGGSAINGLVSDAAVYSAALTDDEVAALAAGYSPLLIRPDALVAYWKLIDADGDVDWWGQNDMTATNSPTYTQHPPIIYPSGLVFVNQTVAGGVGGNRRRRSIICGAL